MKSIFLLVLFASFLIFSFAWTQETLQCPILERFAKLEKEFQQLKQENETLQNEINALKQRSFKNVVSFTWKGQYRDGDWFTVKSDLTPGTYLVRFESSDTHHPSMMHVRGLALVAVGFPSAHCKYELPIPFAYSAHTLGDAQEHPTRISMRISGSFPTHDPAKLQMNITGASTSDPVEIKFTYFELP